MNDVMMDIETLGNSPGSVVVSVGLVMFDEDNIGSKKEFFFDVSDQPQYGLKLDPETVMWWMIQSDTARTRLVDGAKEGGTLKKTLQEIRTFLYEESKFLKGLRVWGNSASFDCGIMVATFKAAGYKTPWVFWNERCYRTLLGMTFTRAEINRFKKEHLGDNAHSAVDDAVFQVKMLQEVLKKNGMVLR